MLEIRIFTLEQAWSKSPFLQTLFTWPVNLCIPFSVVSDKRASLKTQSFIIQFLLVQQSQRIIFCQSLPFKMFSQIQHSTAWSIMIWERTDTALNANCAADHFRTLNTWIYELSNLKSLYISEVLEAVSCIIGSIIFTRPAEVFDLWNCCHENQAVLTVFIHVNGILYYDVQQIENV